MIYTQPLRLTGTIPFSAYNWFTRCFLLYSNNMQVIMAGGSHDQDNGIWIRNKDFGANTWNNWRKS